MYLTLCFSITRSDSHIISDKSSSEWSWSKANCSLLWSLCKWMWFGFIITILLYSWANICIFIENPSISRSGIKQSSNLLWWVSNINIWNIYKIMLIYLFNMHSKFFSFPFFGVKDAIIAPITRNMIFTRCSLTFILFYFCKFKSSMASCFGKVNWLAVSAYISI